MVEIDFSDKHWSEQKTALGQIIPSYKVGDVFLAITCEGDPAHHLFLHYDKRLEVLEEEFENFSESSILISSIGPKAFDGKYLIIGLTKETRDSE